MAKNILVPLGIIVAASAIDTGIQKKTNGSGTTTLIISNEEMHEKMEIVQALEDSIILLKGITRTIKNETKEQNGGLLGILLDTLRACLQGNMLTGKAILKAGFENKKGKGLLRAGYGNKKGKRVLRAGYGSKYFQFWKNWFLHPIL